MPVTRPREPTLPRDSWRGSRGRAHRATRAIFLVRAVQLSVVHGTDIGIFLRAAPPTPRLLDQVRDDSIKYMTPRSTSRSYSDSACKRKLANAADMPVLGRDLGCEVSSARLSRADDNRLRGAREKPVPARELSFFRQLRLLFRSGHR